MASALWCIFALAVMVASCSAQTCRSLIGSSCTGDQYTCMSDEVTCQSTWNNTCYSRSDLASVLGVQVRSWQKGCTLTETSPYDCRGAYAAPMCTYTSFLGIRSGNCVRCCRGDQCNTGAPPRASAGALAALSPIVLSLLSALVVFLLK